MDCLPLFAPVEATDSKSYVNGVCIYTTRHSNEPDKFTVASMLCDSPSADWACVTISREHCSEEFDIVQLAVVQSIEFSKRGNDVDSRSLVSISIEAALSAFFANTEHHERNHLEICALRHLVDSQWFTWLSELMASPILDEILKSVHSIKFCIFTNHDGDRGQSEEIYTVNYPRGPNGTADTITAEYTLMAEHIDRLTHNKALEIPGWTIIVTKLDVLDPLADSLSLIGVTDDNTTSWRDLIHALYDNPHVTSLKIPGILSKHLGELDYMWAIMTKKNLQFLDLGGENERWNSALEACKGHYQ